MACPVCGNADAKEVCDLCGTDLHALLGPDRSELQIHPVKPEGNRSKRTPSP